MRNISELGLIWSGPTISLTDIRDLEIYFAVSLPADYLRFLSSVNGGVPKANRYDYLRAAGDQGQVIVGDIHRISTDHEDFGDVWKNTQLLRDNLAEIGRNTEVMAVGRDGSINPIYLNMSITAPSVHILYLDDELLDYKIADNFEEFIDGLKL